MSRVIVRQSTRSFEQTVDELLAAIERRGLTLFAQVDHAAGARAAGLELADEQVLTFGNPQGGTPLMQSDPRIGIELPLRMLVWSTSTAEVLVGFNDPRELASSYAVAEQRQTLEQMATLLEALAHEACGGRLTFVR
jgi:uncharacterized protein (DUF302 family)